jgi:hypothetical protein
MGATPYSATNSASLGAVEIHTTTFTRELGERTYLSVQETCASAELDSARNALARIKAKTNPFETNIFGTSALDSMVDQDSTKAVG